MTRPYFNKDGTVCEDRLLRSGETVRIIHQCRSVGRPNKNKSLQNKMYRKLVKGEYEKSALDLCTYLDQVKCCPLDFMHWLFGGIVKAFWKRVLIPSKKASNSIYFSKAEVEKLFAHFKQLKPNSRFQRGNRFTLDNYDQLKMAEFMTPSECFPMSFYELTSSYYKKHVLSMLILIRYLCLPKWMRIYLTSVDKENVQLIQKDYDKSLYDLHGYGESSYSANCHHFASHAYYLAELYDGRMGQFSAEGAESSYGFFTKSNMSGYGGHKAAAVPLYNVLPRMIEQHPCDTHLRISDKSHWKHEDRYDYYIALIL